MLRAIVIALSFTLATAQSGAQERPQRLSGDDVLVLEGALHDLCMADGQKIVVSDAPETRVHLPAHPDPTLERDYGSRLSARAGERRRWPLSQPCGNVTIIPATRIQSFFDRTRRVPDDWGALLQELGVEACMTISRPAYSSDRTRAVITTRYRYGEELKTDRVVELTRTVNGWRVLRSFSGRIE